MTKTDADLRGVFHGKLSPAMRVALLDEHGRHATCRALEVRQLARIVATRGGSWQIQLTEPGKRVAQVLRSELDATPIVPVVRRPTAEVYDPYWVRNLVEAVGRELHDMDVLAADVGDKSEFAIGQSATWQRAAGYLARSVRQSAARLGLTELLEASRAGKGVAERLAIPQRVEEA